MAVRALHSVELASLPWSLFKFSGGSANVTKRLSVSVNEVIDCSRTSRLGLSNRLAAMVLFENGAKCSSLNLYELIRDRPQLRQRVLTE